jgi:hypothetical protein
MRALRTVFGVVLLLAGVPMVLLAATGWSVLRQGPDGDGFAPTSAFVRADGRAVLVADMAALAERARVAVLPGSDRVRVTVRSESGPLFVALAPTVHARRYLDGVARTELSAADGMLDVEGPGVPAPAVARSFWDMTAERGDGLQRLEFTPRPDTSLVIVKANGEAGIDATVTVGSYPNWLGAGTWWLLVGGMGAVMAGVALLAWPERRREVVLVVEANQMVDFADRITEAFGGSSPSPYVHTGRHHDLTGELVALDRIAPHQNAPHQNAPHQGGRHGRDRYANDTGRLTALEPNQRRALHDPTGESPYVTTAT